MKDIFVIVIGGLIIKNNLFAKCLDKYEQIYIDINTFDHADIEQLITQQIVLHRDKQIIIIGYSTGGLIAFSLLDRLSYDIHKLILINSTPYFMAAQNWRGISPANYKKLYDKLITLNLSDFCNYFLGLSYYPRKRPLDDILINISLNKDNILNWLQFIQDNDYRQLINYIRIPTLIINSEHDQIVKSNQFQQNENITQYILPDCTHADLNETLIITYLESFIHA